MDGWFVTESLLLGPRCESMSLDHIFCIFLPLVFLIIAFAEAHGLAEPHQLRVFTPISDNHFDPQRECDTKHILHAWILPQIYVYITLHIPLNLSFFSCYPHLAVVSHL